MASNCVNGDVRLRERNSEAQGLIEVCIDGAWSAVCSDSLTMAAALVVCRQLNRSAGIYKYTLAYVIILCVCASDAVHILVTNMVKGGIMHEATHQTGRKASNVWKLSSVNVHTCFALLLFHTAAQGLEIYSVSRENLFGTLNFLRCTGGESNLLQCLRSEGGLVKRQSSCSTGSVAGVRCAGN